MSIARLYDFAPNTTILSAQVDAELSQLVDYINTLLADVATINTEKWKVPATTVMPFYQAAAPTGFTRVTSIDDKFFRVVSAGSPGTTGGTLAASAAHSHTHALTGAYAKIGQFSSGSQLTTAHGAQVRHASATFNGTEHYWQNDGNLGWGSNNSSTHYGTEIGGTADSDGTAAHAYADFLIASKDAY